jgi:RNA polymerase sigma-70 factor (ECF subfamily)
MTTETEAMIRDYARQGNVEAIVMIYDASAAPLLAFLISLLGNKLQAEEVLQRVFVKLACDPGKIAKARKLKAYLFTIARNEAASFCRKHRREVPAPADWDTLLAPAEEPRCDADTRAAIAEAPGSLPSDQREVVVLKCLQGQTFAEIASHLATAASRYRYAMEKLRKELRKWL